MAKLFFSKKKSQKEEPAKENIKQEPTKENIELVNKLKNETIPTKNFVPAIGNNGDSIIEEYIDEIPFNSKEYKKRKKLKKLQRKNRKNRR